MLAAMGREFYAAYFGVWKPISIVFGAIVLFSWAAGAFDISLAELFHQIVATYQRLLYPVVEFMFGWLLAWLPDWWRDASVFYLVIGGAVARTLWSFYERQDTRGDIYGPPVIGRIRNRWAQLSAVILTVPFWPVTLAPMLLAPYVMRNDNNGNLVAGTRKKYEQWLARPALKYQCNLRWVFLLQLLAVLAGVGVLIVWNAAQT